MDDLHRRFAALDRVPRPDLWADIERRADSLAAATPEALKVGRPAWRGGAAATGAAPAMRTAAIALVILGLLAALLVGALAGGVLRRDDHRPAILPPAVAPSLQPSPSTQVACNVATPPTSVQITSIKLPSGGLDARYAACSLWVQSDSNGGGIERVDLTTDKVAATIVPDEVVDAIATNGDAFWAVAQKAIMEPGDRASLVRIDPTSNAVVDRIALPAPLLGPVSTDGLAIVDQQAWIFGKGAGGASDRAGLIRIIDLGSRGLTATIGIGPAFTAEVVGFDGRAVWVTSVSLDDAFHLSRIDRLTHAVTTLATPPGTGSCVFSNGALYCITDRGVLVQISTETGQTVGRIQLGTDLAGGAYLVSDGPNVWAMPVLMLPNGTGYRLEARELVRLEAATGQVVDRIAHVFKQPIFLWTGGGSLWVVTATDPLVRIEIPAHP